MANIANFWLSPAISVRSRCLRMVAQARQYPLLSLLVFLFVLVTPAIFADFIAPHDPIRGNILERLMPPAWLDGGSWNHPLGTDKLGRDMLSRIIFGARISLTIAVISIICGGIVGTTLGLIAGYFGGLWDHIIMRSVDIKNVMAFNCGKVPYHKSELALIFKFLYKIFVILVYCPINRG